GAVALSAVAFTPKPAQAATYSTTLEFSGQIIQDTCTVSLPIVQNPVPLSILNSVPAVPIDMGIVPKNLFTANNGKDTPRQSLPITIDNCTNISTIDVGWTQLSSTFLGNGV